ncbi:MAG: RNA-binding domain-containing protein, partial [Chitinivibrionales bacterium]
KADEGKTLEFKQDLSSQRNLLKTLVAFANTAGGKIVIGVADKTQEPLRIENPLDEEERLCNLITDSIRPRLVPNVEMTTVDGKTLLVIEIFLSNSRPHYLSSEGPETGVYVRLGSTNRQADRELIEELRRTAEGIPFDEMPMPELATHDLNIEAAQKAFGNWRKLDKQTLLTLKLLTQHQGKPVPTKGGVLLFGKERTQHFSDAWIQCGRFFGIEKIDIFDHIDIDVTLPNAVDEVMLFLKKHAYHGADLSEVRRKDVWSIPLGILREVIINALVHSDYSQRGAPIRVVFLDDRIEVESMGILLPGLTIEEMKQGASRIRNPVIARVFKELGLIEQWGTGVRRIFAEARELGLPEPKIEEIAMRLRFTVYLAEPLHIQTGATEQVEAQVEAQVDEQVDEQVSEQVTTVLNACKNTPRTKVELLQMLGLANAYMNYKRHLLPLIEQGFIEMTIPDKPNSRLQKYRLTAKGKRTLEGGK